MKANGNQNPYKNLKVFYAKNKTAVKVFGVTVVCFIIELISMKGYNSFIRYRSMGIDTFESLYKAIDEAISFSGVLEFSVQGLLFGFIFVFLFIAFVLYKEADKKNVRRGEEYGSARKGDIFKESLPLNAMNNPKKEKQDEDANMILSENIHLDLDTRHTRLNDNIFVVGGSGTGKTRYFVKPNIMQMYCNYVVIDPKGSVAVETGKAFAEAGYNVTYLDLNEMEKSMGYNPFEYFNEPEDVQDFVQNVIDNTTDKSKSGGDEFFVKAEFTWLTAACFYVASECRGTDMCNMNSVMLLLDRSEAREEDENFVSEVDQMFIDLEREHYRNTGGVSNYTFQDMAIKNYKFYKLAAGKTAKSILVSIAARLQPFLQPKLQRILEKDELHLERIGAPMVINKKDGKQGIEYDIDKETYDMIARKNNLTPYEDLPKERLRKSILFIVISDYKGTFGFMASIILQQLYAQLYYTADNRSDNRLPIHTRFINDEFANCGKQPDFSRKISTMRSREISTAVIVQGISQIKAKSLYGDEWEAIFENCDTTLFLGSKGPTTQETIKKLAGKETVTHITHSETKGTNSSATEGEQIIARDLYDEGELGRLDNNLCLVHIRGHFIYEDRKYDILNHKRVDLTADSPNEEIAKKNRFDLISYIKKIRDVEEKREFHRIRFVGEELGVLDELDKCDALKCGEFIGDMNNFETDDEVYITPKDMDVIEYDIESEEQMKEEISYLPTSTSNEQTTYY